MDPGLVESSGWKVPGKIVLPYWALQFTKTLSPLLSNLILIMTVRGKCHAAPIFQIRKQSLGEVK